MALALAEAASGLLKVPPVQFIEGELRHTKDRYAGQRIILRPWQIEILEELFREDEAGERVYTEGLIGEPRKGGKSTIGAALGLHGLVADGVFGAEVYSAAGDKDQARVVFGTAKRMVEFSPSLSRSLKVWRDVIEDPGTDSIYRVLSADAPLKHGLNPSLVVFDEVWNQPSADLYEALTTGSGTRERSLVIMLTTAGFDQRSLLWKLYQRGLKGRDPRFYFRWFGLLAGSRKDYRSPETWALANPALGDFLREDFLADMCRRLPENVFRRLHLNQWCVTYDTLIRLADGSSRRADALRPGDLVVGFDEDLRRLVVVPVTAILDNGTQPIYRIRTKRGREVSVTAEHPFWVRWGRPDSPRYGWVKAGELRPGDRVAVALDHPGGYAAVAVEPDVAQFLGIMVGDGYCGGGSPGLTSSDPEIVRFVQDFARACGIKLKPRGDHPMQYRLSGELGHRPNPVSDLLREFGLYGSNTYTKRVPQQIAAAGPEAWAAFMSGYLDTDGCVSGRAVIWVSANRPLLADCQDLLAMMGVQSNLRAGRSPACPFPSWRLEVHEARSLDILAQVLSPCHSAKGLKLAALRGLVRRTGPAAEDRFLFDPVEEVTLLQPAATLGIEIRDYHTHVTNGLITHNTSSETTWITSRAWDACKAKPKIELGSDVVLGVDTGVKHDSTAAVLTSLRDGKVDAEFKVWQPDDEQDEVLDLGLVEDYIRQVGRAYHLIECVYDPYHFGRSAQMLEEEGLPMVEYPQDSTRMAPASQTLYDLIQNRRLRHGADPVAREHALSAVAKETERGWRLSKIASKRKIDAMVALAMAVDRLLHTDHAGPAVIVA